LVPICHDQDLANFFQVDPEELEEVKEDSLIEINLEPQKLKFRRLTKE